MARGLCASLPLCILLACTSKGEKELLRLAPSLSTEMARHLVDGNEAAFVEYAESVDCEELRYTRSILLQSLVTEDPEQWARDRATLAPSLVRISTYLHTACSDSSAARYDRFLMSVSPEVGLRIRRLYKRQFDILADRTLSSEAKLSFVRAFRDSFAALEAECEYIVALRLLSEHLNDTSEDHPEVLSILHEAVDAARAAGDPGNLCQNLGMLGVQYQRRGMHDSTLAQWTRGLELAIRSRHAEQAPRLAHFLSVYYSRMGRTGLAAEYLDLGLELCQAFKGGVRELRFLKQWLEYYALQGDWDLVERQLPRARLLLERYPTMPGVTVITRHQLQMIQTWAQAANGHPHDAAAAFSSVEARFRNGYRPAVYPKFMADWVFALVEGGLWEEALAVTERGLAVAEEDGNRWMIQEFAVQRGRALVALGRFEEASAWLVRIEAILARSGVREPWNRYWLHLLGAKVAASRKDAPSTRAELQATFEVLKSLLTRSEPSAQTYRLVDRSRDFFQLMHALTRGSPELSYQIQLAKSTLWEDIGTDVSATPLARGTAPSAGTVPSAPRAGCIEFAPECLLPGEILRRGIHASRIVEEWRLDSDGIHLLFAQIGDSLVRWVSDRSGLRQDILAVTLPELRDLVETTMQQLATDPQDTGATLPPELQSRLERLSEVLLPVESLRERAQGAPIPLLITANGLLGNVPFWALDLDPSERYVPVLDDYDVAALRSVRRLGDRVTAGPGLVLTAPSLPENLLRKYPELKALSHAPRESHAVLDARPGSELLSGAGFTKGALQSKWGKAGFIYVSAHSVRDPVNPYLTFLPVAEPSQGPPRPDASRVEVIDIRRQDLSRCSLVALSSCSSGTPPFLSDRNASAPSLADAFVDAGAHAVVQTYWRIDDMEAERFMTVFIEEWGRKQRSPLEALSAARRAAVHGAPGVRHPFWWAVYAVELGGLYPPRDPASSRTEFVASPAGHGCVP